MSLNFDTYAAKGKLMLNELALELGIPEDKAKAGRIMRTVLHTLRDLLPLEENLQFTAQLPMVLKGVYLDGWKYSAKPRRIKHLSGLAAEVYEQAGRPAPEDFPTEEDTLDAVRAVIKVLRMHVSVGEIQDIKGAMPKHLKELWDEPVWID